jgi:hypothetical protein
MTVAKDRVDAAFMAGVVLTTAGFGLTGADISSENIFADCLYVLCVIHSLAAFVWHRKRVNDGPSA